jgi:hypothetical protein
VTVNQPDRDVSWTVVFRLGSDDDWHEWTRNHRSVPEAVRSAEVLVKTPPVVEIRFDRITVQRERFSLAELPETDEPAAVSPPADRAAEHADAAYTLMERFQRKAEEAESNAALLPAPDHRAVLLLAADAIDRETQRLKDHGVLEPDKFRPCRDASAQLRDMADCPACEARFEHIVHCPTPETHNWGCGCPTDQAPEGEQQGRQA